MKQRARVVETQQARLALAALGEIHHIYDDRHMNAIEFMLATKIAHPGAAALRRPREIIADEQGDRRAVLRHRPRARVWMVERQVEALGEGEAKQAIGGIER